MDSMTFSILVAVTAALAVVAVWQIVAGQLNGDKRKLQSRLLRNSENVATSFATRTLTLQTQDDSLSARLGRMPVFAKINKSLAQGYTDAKLTTFLAIVLCAALFTFAITLLVMDSFMAALVAAAMAGYAPVLLVRGRAGKRQVLISRQLPEALDFLSRVLRAGHSLSTGLQLMGDELPEPLGGEFRRCYAQHSLGQSLEDALRDMIGRIDSGDFAFFVTSVLIQRQTGGDLSEVLTNISAMVRQRIRLQQHVKAITAEGRLTSYILVAFPVVLFAISYVLNPEYAGVLLRTDTGRILLGAAVFLQLLGLLVIRRIVTVRF